MSFYLIQRIRAQDDLNSSDLISSPSDVGYQNLQADSNKATVMEILEQMPSSQGKRQGKGDYTSHCANYGKPDALAEGQRCGIGAGDRRNFRKLEILITLTVKGCSRMLSRL